MDALGYLALFGTGLAAGVLNVLAGGGSFLTLPLLLELGLPEVPANATNRVGIAAQNVGAVWSFRSRGVSNWRWALANAGPALVGAALGAWIATRIDGATFRRVLAFLMIAVTLWTLWNPGAERAASNAGRDPGSRFRLVLLPAFFAVGVYGGFVQAGVGFFVLAITTAAGFDLVRGNAIKVFVILGFTVVSLSWFAWHGHVWWGAGAALAAGTVVGGQLGVRFAIAKGHRWLRGVVTVAVIALAVRLWLAA